MKPRKPAKKKSARESLAAAFQKVAVQFEREWENGERSWAVDGGDLIEVLRAVADELKASGKNSRPTN